MSELKFTATDFKNVTLGHYGATPTIEQVAANIANARLAQMLEACPVVYGRIPDEGKSFITITENRSASFDTHRARLVAIEPIGGKE